MSASNVILHRVAGYLFSDAAGIGPDGRLTFIASKIAILPRMRAAVVQRGLGNRVRQALKWFSDFNEVEEAASCLHAYVGDVMRVVRRDHWLYMHAFTPSFSAVECALEVTIVGWSSRMSRPVAYSVATVDWSHPDRIGPMARESLPAMEIAALCPIAWRPRFDGDPEIVLGRPLSTVADVDELDPECDGLKILQAQRCKFVDRPDSGPVSVIGGFAEMATVTAEGVAVKRIHTWQEDEIGKRIRPRVRVRADHRET